MNNFDFIFNVFFKGKKLPINLNLKLFSLILILYGLRIHLTKSLKEISLEDLFQFSVEKTKTVKNFNLKS